MGFYHEKNEERRNILECIHTFAAEDQLNRVSVVEGVPQPMVAKSSMI